jgi:hypothetical protein
MTHPARLWPIDVEILLGLSGDLGVVIVLDFLVTGDNECRTECGNLSKVGDPLTPG